MFREQFTDVRNTCALAEGIVDAVRQPILVLDQQLRVIAANRSFYSTFKVNTEDTRGRLIYTLSDEQWEIPALHMLLEKIIPEQGMIEGYKVEHNFPGIGPRILLLNAHKVPCDIGTHTTIFLGIEDVTQKYALEQEMAKLLWHKDVLLGEMQHRVANSLQIIASIIMKKARTVESKEARRDLQEIHQRVLSVAAVQQHLHTTAAGKPIQLGPYFSKLCDILSHSMISDNHPVSLEVCGEGEIATCRDAESLGLIVTELVINSLKHAFNADTKDGQITVAFEASGTDWKLSVADNGIGKPDGGFAQPKTGLGTGIVNALAKQLDAQIVTLNGPKGTTVSVTHAAFTAKKLPIAERPSDFKTEVGIYA